MFDWFPPARSFDAMRCTAVLAVLGALMGVASGQYSQFGMGTAYSGPWHMDITGQNMCEFVPRELDVKWQVYYAAMNEADWNEAGGKDGICGRCIAVRGVEGETTKDHYIQPIKVKVGGAAGAARDCHTCDTASCHHFASPHPSMTDCAQIVDQCPAWACDKGNVDFSTTALEAITGYSWCVAFHLAFVALHPLLACQGCADAGSFRQLTHAWCAALQGQEGHHLGLCGLRHWPHPSASRRRASGKGRPGSR